MQASRNHVNRARAIQPPTGYIPGLDGLRGLAVLAVICFHVAGYADPTSVFGVMVYSLLRFGWVGVDLFFVLSGFLITGILYDNRNGSTRLRGFYGRRLLRIAPLYYCTLAVLFVLVPFTATPEQVAALYSSLPWHGAFLTNIRVALADSWSAAPMKTSHLWSLAVEEQFYLVWPALITATVAWAKSPRVALIRICMALVVASIGFRLWALPQYDLAAYTLLFTRMDALAIGAAVSLWIRGPDGIGPALKLSRPLMLVCGAALLILGVLSGGSHSYLHPLQQGAGYTLWAALFAAILIYVVAVRNGRLARTLTVKPLVGTGRISYGLYVLHFPIMYFLEVAGVLTLGIIPFGVCTIIASFLVSLLAWRYVETPFLKLKRFFPYDGKSGDTRSSNTQIVHDR